MSKTSIVTCTAVLSYPALFEPKENLSGALKYSCTLLFDKGKTKGLKELTDVIAVATEKGKSTLWSGKVPKFRYEALRDGDEELSSGQKEDKVYTNKMFLNCTSNSAPGVCDEHAKPLMDQKKIYAGCIVRAQLNAFPYKNSGNCGVAWGLNGIMFIEDGPRLDGRIDSEEAFAGYAIETEGESENPDNLM